ncbi:MAG: ATP synthase F1 subunit epsilon [Magnetococcales bacterium]|nr:ATP synthase F1 subunit epsilon [Magnetococcales bacterium]MBF0437940.1 ATP synthase F1 subunit epsilon [Magnetococcales bacterium]
MSIVVQLEIVTPEALLLTEETMLVTAPGAEGYFGVMAGHAPFVTLLKPGTLTLGEGDDAKRHVIAGGYAEILPEKVTILTERALSREQITMQQAKSEQLEAEGKLAALQPEDSLVAFWQLRLDFALACQEMLNTLKV